MIINRNFLYFLLYMGVLNTFSSVVPLMNFNLRWDGSSNALKEINHERPESNKFPHAAALKATEESQTAMLARECKDISKTTIATSIDKFLNTSKISDGVFLQKEGPVNEIVTGTSPQIVSKGRLKDKVDIVSNGIDDSKRFVRSKRSAIISSNTTTVSTSLVTSNYHSRFADVENSIRTINENIEQLKRSISLSDEDKERFATLEERAINLENLVDNQIRVVDKERDKFKNTIDNLSNAINSLNTDLLALQRKATEEERSQKQKRLTNECIDDIQSHNFAAAEGKLNLIEDENKINLIVHQVYNYQAANFYLVLQFGDYISNISRRFLVYKGINYEMENNRHKDPSKMIRLIESLNSRIVNLWNTAWKLKHEAESLVDNITISIRAVGKETLREGMLYDRYTSVVNIAKTIYDFNNEMFKELIGEVVNEVHGRISIEKLINTIPNEPRYAEHTAPAYLALLNAMQRNGEFNTNAVFKVAYRIKSAVMMDNSNFFILKNRLPESVKNAVFASKVCIKNVMRSEYLYSARPAGYTYDKDRGYVYTWIPGSKVTEADWVIEPDGDNFYIKNYMRGEYLYSARPAGYTYDKDRGYVFTWIPGNRVPEGTWKIEPYGDNCYIKNYMNNEYLYVARPAGYSYDQYRDYVFTWIPGNRVSSAEWKVEDCS